MPHHHSDVGGSASSDPQWFVNTHWSLVFAAGSIASPQSLEALNKLCETYWMPLYNHVRRQGYNPEDAKDLIQAFFEKSLKKNLWARADPNKGRFRCFLLTALRHFLADQRDRATAAKRGGGVPPISIHESQGEDELPGGPSEAMAADLQFDRQWAFAVLEQARAKFRAECIASGKSALYEHVNLLGDDHDKTESYAEIARKLGTTVSAVKSAVLRLRQRYAELVREEVAHTVSSPAEVDSELQYLLTLIS